MNDQERQEKINPGPWRLAMNRSRGCSGAIRGMSSCRIVDAKNHTVDYAAPQKCKARQSANANLLAAAPEMYDALKDLMDALDFALSNSERVPDCIVAVAQDAMEKAEAAQKKARGEE